MNGNRSFAFDRRKLILGCALVLLGVVSPLFITAGTFRIVDVLTLSIRDEQSAYLLEGALLLVLLNTLRCLPHYLGTFLIIQSLHFSKARWQMVKNLVFSVLIIALVYWLIETLYGIRYDFAVPAVLMIFTVISVERLNLTMVSIIKEILMMTMILAAIQFLDVMPGLDQAFFGRGELATDIKRTAEFLQADGFLRGMCFIFMAIFIFSGVILGLQISLENQLRKTRRDSDANREQLMETRLRLLDARISKEQQFLVHDLKAPLTSIQLWVDLLQMKSDEGECMDCRDYITHINSSISHMNLLISEIMNSRTRSVYTVQEVLKLFSSQTSPAEYSRMLEISSDCDGVKLDLNRTNFVRALINLTDNAFRSLHREDGRISVGVTGDGETVSFSVTDNGEGIRPELLDRIWEKGVSGRGSTGVGLFFVKEVTEELGGSVSIASTPGEGTTVTLKVPVHPEI